MNEGPINDADTFKRAAWYISSRSACIHDALTLSRRLGAEGGDRESHHSIQVLGRRSRVSGWGLCLRQRGPGSASIHREGTNSTTGVSIILYEVPEEKDNPRVIFVRRDEKYFLVELWGVQNRYVVTAEFQHRGEVSEQQRRLPMTIVEAHDQ
jgi:hypothetical protein